MLSTMKPRSREAIKHSQAIDDTFLKMSIDELLEADRRALIINGYDPKAEKCFDNPDDYQDALLEFEGTLTPDEQEKVIRHDEMLHEMESNGKKSRAATLWGIDVENAVFQAVVRQHGNPLSA